MVAATAVGAGLARRARYYRKGYDRLTPFCIFTITARERLREDALTRNDVASLVDRIYEASVLVERWPELLQDIADRAGARGMTIVSRSPHRFDLVTSPAIGDVAADFIDQGWGADTGYTAPLFAEQWPGFRTESDYRTPEEIAAMPVHREFLDPRGFIAGAATVIQGTDDLALHVAVEGFASHSAAKGAVGFLDGLRPHLARSISLMALHRDRSRLVVESLALAAIAAAVVGPDLRLRAVNAPFAERMGNRMAETPGGVRFADTFLMRQVGEALDRQRHRQGSIQSIAVWPRDGSVGFAVHLLPILGAAREACGGDGVLMLVADPANASVPSADLLRLLFDLTPAESRLTRRIAEGEPVEAAARASQVSIGTARAQLRSVFTKVGVRRQAELVRLVAGLGAPGD